MSSGMRWTVWIGCGLFATGCHRGSRGHWTTEQKRAFVQHCQKTNPGQKSCGCVADALEKTMSYADFQGLSDATGKSKAPSREQMAEVRDAVMACQPEKK